MSNQNERKDDSCDADKEKKYFHDLTVIHSLNKKFLGELTTLRESFGGELPPYIEDEVYACMKKSAIFQQLIRHISKSQNNMSLSGLDLADYVEDSQELLEYENSLLRLMEDSSSDDSLFDMNPTSNANKRKSLGPRYLRKFLKSFFDSSKTYLPRHGQISNNVTSTSTLFVMSADSFFNITLPGESQVRLEAVPDVTLKEVVMNAIKYNEESEDKILLLDMKEKRIIKSNLPSTVFVGMNLKVFYNFRNNTLPPEEFHEMESKTLLIPANCVICSESFHIGIRCKKCTKYFHKKCNVRFPTLCDKNLEEKEKPLKSSMLEANNFEQRTRSKTASRLVYNTHTQYQFVQQKNKNIKRYTNFLKDDASHDVRRDTKISVADIIKLKLEDEKNSAKKGAVGVSEAKQAVEKKKKKKKNAPGETWEIDVGEVTLIKKIGSGSFGTVYEAQWHGAVAVKVLNLADPTDEQIEAFKNELLIFRKTRHNNILLYMGCFYTPHLAIVTEWCDGSLYHFLHVKEAQYTQKRLVEVAIASANGMSYLHDKNIIHRDLKSNNILLRNNIVKIADFGLSMVKSKKAGIQHIQQPTGSVLWMAPEVIRMSDKSPYTFNSDVYSFGIVLYELISLKLPYQNIGSRDQILYMVGRGYLRPDENDIRKYIGPQLRSIYKECISFDRDRRPSFCDIGERLKAYYLEIPSITRSTSAKITKLSFNASSYL